MTQQRKQLALIVTYDGMMTTDQKKDKPSAEITGTFTRAYIAAVKNVFSETSIELIIIAENCVIHFPLTEEVKTGQKEQHCESKYSSCSYQVAKEIQAAYNPETDSLIFLNGFDRDDNNIHPGLVPWLYLFQKIQFVANTDIYNLLKTDPGIRWIGSALPPCLNTVLETCWNEKLRTLLHKQ